MIYSDIDTFESKVDIDEDAVINAITNLLSVSPGEILFDPTFGCNLDELIGNLNDSHFIRYYEVYLQDLILNNDPRIDKANVTITTDGQEANINIDLILKNGLEISTVLKVNNDNTIE